MKTIPTNDHQLRRHLTAQLFRPQQNASISLFDETAFEFATHDFLVLSARPDLAPENASLIVRADCQ